MKTSIRQYSRRKDASRRMSAQGRAAPGRRNLSACLLGLFLIHSLADTAEARFFLELGDLLEGTQALNIYVSKATGISADGSTVVGSSKYPGSGFLKEQPFRWTAATGMVALSPVSGW